MLLNRMRNGGTVRVAPYLSQAWVEQGRTATILTNDDGSQTAHFPISHSVIHQPLANQGELNTSFFVAPIRYPAFFEQAVFQCQVGNAVFATQVLQHDPNLVLGPKVPTGLPPDVPHHPFGGGLRWQFFRGGLDVPSSLRRSPNPP